MTHTTTTTRSRGGRTMQWRAAFLTAVLATTALGAGCVDPDGKLDEFLERSEPFRAQVATGACEGRVDASGDYLLAIATVVLPTAPVLFDATVTVDTTVDPWAITVAMQPLAVDGRANVGDVLTATGTVDADGRFDLDFGEITIPGAANAILVGTDAVATLTLAGCTNTAEFTCGTADGAISSPASIPLAGSTYGAIAVDGDLTTADPVALCPTE